MSKAQKNPKSKMIETSKHRKEVIATSIKNIHRQPMNYDEADKSIPVDYLMTVDPKNRKNIYDSLQDMNKELVIILYGSVVKFIKAKNIHPLETYILRYDTYMGIENDIISLSIDLNCQLTTNEPSLEMYTYLLWMVENPDQIHKYKNF